MKITVVTEACRIDVEVALPFYRYHDAGGDDYCSEHWTKIEKVAPGVNVQRTLNLSHSLHSPGATWSATEKPFQPSGDTADYVLGRGPYALTPEGWEEARRAYESWLRSQEFLERDAVLADVKRLQDACSRQNDDVCQTLGKALGYPWFKDDQKNFPGATETNGVCVGEHIAETIAIEAANRLTAALALAGRLREALIALGGTEPDDCFDHCSDRSDFHSPACLATRALLTDPAVEGLK